MLSEDRRHEIATFLRTRRARLRPEQVGLPPGARRRTPGLRREEVAALASVSTEWYRWLEQARDVRASEDVLRRIGGALRLEPGEARHLLLLGGYEGDGRREGAAAAHSATIGPPLQRLLDQLGDCPAWVHGERWDIVAWNRAATVIWGELAAMEGGGIERNALHQLFLSPRLRRMLVDWETHARDCVAKLRAAHARSVDDPWFNALIRHLRARSPEFAAWWDDHLVHPPRDGVKRYAHPEVGTLSFDYTSLAVADERFAPLRLTVYLPVPASGTRERLACLLGSGDAVVPDAVPDEEAACLAPS